MIWDDEEAIAVIVYAYLSHRDLDYGTALRWYGIMASGNWQRLNDLTQYGFALRHGAGAEMSLDERGAFLREFVIKILLALFRNCDVPKLPLFAMTNIQVVGNRLVHDGREYALIPGGES